MLLVGLLSAYRANYSILHAGFGENFIKTVVSKNYSILQVC
jgi:hypothetical protein